MAPVNKKRRKYVSRTRTVRDECDVMSRVVPAAPWNSARVSGLQPQFAEHFVRSGGSEHVSNGPRTAAGLFNGEQRMTIPNALKQGLLSRLFIAAIINDMCINLVSRR